MSLFETFYKKCIIMDKTKQPDGEGGVINTWTDGAAFDAAFPELSPAAQIAAQQSVPLCMRSRRCSTAGLSSRLQTSRSTRETSSGMRRAGAITAW